MDKPQSIKDIPIRDGHERIQVMGNLWVDINLSNYKADKYIGAVGTLRFLRHRRKIREITRCEVARIKRQILYRKKVSPN